jgi:hypothetical protein
MNRVSCILHSVLELRQARDDVFAISWPRQIFGSNKAKPKPNLTDAISSTDTRMGSIEVKVKKLDAELGVFKAQMAKMRDGPGKVSGVSLPSWTVHPTWDKGQWNGVLVPEPVLMPLERGTSEGAPDVEAEEAVWRAVGPAPATDIQHGASGDDDGESEEHGGSKASTILEGDKRAA